MSAIEPLGYPDWQRLTNWDGPVLWQPPQQDVNTNIVSDVLRVDRFQSIGGVMQFTSGKAVVTFDWFADPTLTAQLGARQFFIDGDVSPQFWFRLVNMGAWLVVTIEAVAGSTVHVFKVNVAATNRAFPSETISFPSPMLRQAFINLAAGGVNTYNVIPVVTGAAHLFLNSNHGPVSATVFSLTDLGNYVSLVEAVTDANGVANVDFNVPDASIQVQVANGSGVLASGVVSIVKRETS